MEAPSVWFGDLGDSALLLQAAENRDKKTPRAEEYEKPKSRLLDELDVGNKVLIKHHRTCHWNTEAEVLEQRENRLSYIIKDDTGQILIRGRCLLKPKPIPAKADRVLRSQKKTMLLMLIMVRMLRPHLYLI